MIYLIIFSGLIYTIWRGIYILQKGEAKRWELFPFFGVIGASIIGYEKIHGIPARIAGILHLLVGLLLIIALFRAAM